MPVLKKKGALFPVYHDSPSATAATSSSKKDVLAARSPTLRHRKQSSLGSKNAMGGLKSDPTQTQGTRKPLGAIGNAAGRATRDGGKSGTATEKENMRSLGLGKPKMHVFVDDEVNVKPIKPIQTRLGARRALGDKAQPTHAITALNPHKPKPSSILPEPTFGRGQENIPPPGEYTADRPPPAQRSTRRTTAAGFPTTFTSVPHPATSTPGRRGNPHDSVLDPDSPYITKPRLRKVRPLSAATVEQASTLTEPSSQPPLIASSQPQSQSQGTSLHSSPLVTRPQTRKRPATIHAPQHPGPTALPIHADPTLCDLSEANGADPSLPNTSPGLRRSARLSRTQPDEGPATGLQSSAYGWVQLSAGRWRAPEPPAARGRKGKKAAW